MLKILSKLKFWKKSETSQAEDSVLVEYSSSIDLTNPRRSGSFLVHRKKLITSIDLENTCGLEIGAMDLPYIAPDEGNCDYADFRTTEELKVLATKVVGHNPDFIVPVKHLLRNGYSEIKDRYDWIVAAHVVEHVPDLIGWFNEMDRLLNRKGILFLIVPDRRYTFDFHRRETIFSEVVATHQLQLKTPSYAQVFDHHYYHHLPVDHGLIWAGEQHPPPIKNYAKSSGAALRATRGYEDAHCSVFTPESFVTLLEEIQTAGLTKLRLVEVVETQRNHLDFCVVLQSSDN